MKKLTRKLAKVSVATISAAAIALILGLYSPSGVRADETHAKNLVKAMSDYMASQKAISFEYDSILEVVTTDHQNLSLQVRVLLLSTGLTKSAPHVPVVLSMSRYFLTRKN